MANKTKEIQKRKINYVPQIIGGILLTIAIGLFPVFLVIWVMAGISAADVGGESQFSTIYLLVLIIMAIVGTILLARKPNDK